MMHEPGKMAWCVLNYPAMVVYIFVTDFGSAEAMVKCFCKLFHIISWLNT